MIHYEIHYCETARDAAELRHAGLPRYDLEPTDCSACGVRVGEVNGTNGAVFWRPLGVALNGDSIAVLCRTCLRPVTAALKS